MHTAKYCLSGNILLEPEVSGKYQPETWTLRENLHLKPVFSALWYIQKKFSHASGYKEYDLAGYLTFTSEAATIKFRGWSTTSLWVFLQPSVNKNQNQIACYNSVTGICLQSAFYNTLLFQTEWLIETYLMYLWWVERSDTFISSLLNKISQWFLTTLHTQT